MHGTAGAASNSAAICVASHLWPSGREGLLATASSKQAAAIGAVSALAGASCPPGPVRHTSLERGPVQHVSLFLTYLPP